MHPVLKTDALLDIEYAMNAALVMEIAPMKMCNLKPIAPFFIASRQSFSDSLMLFSEVGWLVANRITNEVRCRKESG